MSRKIISTFTAAAMSMSIALAVPVTATAASSLTVVSEAQAAKKKSLAPRQGSASAKDNTFCGNADTFVVYEEDAQGNPIRGTEEYGCTD